MLYVLRSWLSSDSLCDSFDIQRSPKRALVKSFGMQFCHHRAIKAISCRQMQTCHFAFIKSVCGSVMTFSCQTHDRQKRSAPLSKLLNRAGQHRPIVAWALGTVTSACISCTQVGGQSVPSCLELRCLLRMLGVDLTNWISHGECSK